MLSKTKPLYIWWVSILLIVTAVFWASYNGFLLDIWEKDVTYLTTIIGLIFVYSMGVLGYISWKIPTTAYQDIQHLTDRVWFLSEIEMGLAIVGTSLGIILLLNVNSDINISDPTALQNLLTHLWSTLGVAFYPNALGLISSIIMKIMVFFITENRQ